MRVSLFFTVAFAALLSLQQATAQTCANSRTQCPSTNAAVPTPWYNLQFTADPRATAGVGAATGSYGWQQSLTGDSCAEFHTGLLTLGGSTNRSNDAGPHVDMMTTTGPYSVGSALPGIIGGAGSGSYGQATRGWSIELTIRLNQEGPNTQWAKFVNLGTSSVRNGRGCNGEWVVGWADNTDEVTMSTCTSGNENHVQDFIRDAPDLTWMHIIGVVQYSPNGVATYNTYYNGQFMKNSERVQWLVEMARDRVYLGRSSWGDAYVNGTYDNFAIYDIALTPTMIQGLYGEKMNGCAVNRAPYTNATAITGDVAPTYNAEFTSDITSFGGSTPDFSWVRQDPDDAGCAASAHTGLLKLAGDADWTPSISAGPYVNLSASTGENYIGQTFGTFGNVTASQGNINDATAGFTIEISFKAQYQYPSAKIWSVGNNDGLNCVPGDIWAGWLRSDYSLELTYCDGNRNYRSIVEGTIPMRLRTWYHMVVSVAAQPNGLATWTVSWNGAVAAVVTNQYMPGAIARKHILLGRSMFFGSTDTYFSGHVDKFAVYNRALSSSQAASLATNSGIVSCAQAVNTLTSMPANGVFFKTGFAQDRRPVGAQYNWTQVDADDTPTDQTLHQGLLVLGSRGGTNANQWVNLTASSGVNSIGESIGWFGGDGTGNFIAGTQGWTFEQVFKIWPTTRSTLFANNNSIITNGNDWSKVFDFGDGNKGTNRDQCENDVIFGFDGSNNWMKLQICNTVASEQQVGSIVKSPMKFNTWYHAVQTVKVTPAGTLGALYLNGQLIEETLIRSYPLLASRIDARIGWSSWTNDYKFNGAIDTFAMYSQASNQAQVSSLYALAFNLTTSSTGASGTSAPLPTSVPTPTGSTTGTFTPTTTPTPTSTDRPTDSTAGGGSDEGVNGTSSVSMSILSIVLVVAFALYTL